MADITMCTGKGCDLRNRCFRFTARRGYRQSMFLLPPFDKSDKCIYFWDNNK